LLATVDEAVEKSSCGDDDGLGADGAAVAKAESGNAARATFCVIRNIIDDEFGDLGLLDLEVGLRFENLAHFDAVGLLVTLRAG
jgi:hypothetical protein